MIDLGLAIFFIILAAAVAFVLGNLNAETPAYRRGQQSANELIKELQIEISALRINRNEAIATMQAAIDALSEQRERHYPANDQGQAQKASAKG